jgi:hypothetical protein
MSRSSSVDRWASRLWQRWFGSSQPRRAAQTRQARPALEALEDRTLPATTLTILPGAVGSGSLDARFLQNGGQLAASDGGNAPGTLSTGALTTIGAARNIIVHAGAALTFNDLGGSLNLLTGPGHSASFAAGGPSPSPTPPTP